MAVAPSAAKVFFAKVTAFATSTAVGQVILTTAINYALSSASKLLSGKDDNSGGSSAGREILVRGTTEPQQIIYGEIRTAGYVAFCGCSGDSNKYLWYVVVVAGHQCQEISHCWVDDKLVPASEINGSTGEVTADAFVRDSNSYLYIWKHLGAHNQTADTGLVAAFPEWDASHKGAGVAYVVYRLERQESVWEAGPPQAFYELVKGKRVYDPRKDSTNGGSGSHRHADATTWEWSDCSELCSRDYITGGSKYFSTATPNNILGIREANSRINDEVTIAQANICDEDVAIPISAGLQLIPTSYNIRITRAGDSMDIACGDTGGDSPLPYAYSPQTSADIDFTATDFVLTSGLGDVGALVLDEDPSAYVADPAFLNGRYVFEILNRADGNNQGLRIYKNGVLLSYQGSVVTGTTLRVTYDGSTVTLYKNGSSIYTDSYSGTLGAVVYMWDHGTGDTGMTITDNLAGDATEKRYTCNVQLSCSDTHEENVAILLSSMIGNISVVNGKYCIYAGAYLIPEIEITADDIKGDMQVITHPVGEDLYNAVGGTFYDEARNWQLMPFPIQTNPTYQTDDRGYYLRSIDLRATRGNYRAQRIANVILQQSRNKITIPFEKLSPKASRIAKWENFYLTIPELGYSNQAMKCVDWAFPPSGFPRLTARIESASAYEDLDVVDYIDPLTNAPPYGQVDLPDAPTSLSAVSFPTAIVVTIGLPQVMEPGSVVEIWEHTSSTPFSSATKIAESRNSVVIVSKRDTTGRYYWATIRNRRRGRSTNYPSGAGVSGAGDFVQTGDIADQAATEIYSTTVTSVSVTGLTGAPTGTFTELATISFTPLVDGEILIDADGGVLITTPGAGSAGIDDWAVLSSRIKINGSQVGPLRTYHIERLIGFSASTNANLVRNLRYDVVANTAYTIVLQAQKLSNNVTTTVGPSGQQLDMNVVFVKR